MYKLIIIIISGHLGSLASSYKLKVLLRSSYFLLYLETSAWLRCRELSYCSITPLSYVRISFYKVIFSSSIYCYTCVLVRLSLRSMSTSSSSYSRVLKLWSRSPSFSSTLAIFSLTFFIVMCEGSYFFCAILSELLKSLSASLYCSLISLNTPLEKYMTQLMGWSFERQLNISTACPSCSYAPYRSSTTIKYLDKLQ